MDALAYLRFPLALAFVLGLILLAALILRKYGWPVGSSARQGARLKLIETLPLDPKRRLVLVRRDQVEHLVILAPDGGLVVERGVPVPPSNAPDAIPPRGS